MLTGEKAPRRLIERLSGAVLVLGIVAGPFLAGDDLASATKGTYGYDVHAADVGVLDIGTPPGPADQVEPQLSGAGSVTTHPYDDPSNLARGLARPAGYRLAPNTAASIADDVPAFARSQYGRVPAAERAAALQRAPTCPYCGTNPSSQVDHISALRRDWGAGGWADDFATRTATVNDPGNLIGACASCNAVKGVRAIGEGAGQWWPSGWPSGQWWPFGGGL